MVALFWSWAGKRVEQREAQAGKHRVRVPRKEKKGQKKVPKEVDKGQAGEGHLWQRQGYHKSHTRNSRKSRKRTAPMERNQGREQKIHKSRKIKEEKHPSNQLRNAT